jgi:hypothetical protein
LVVDGHPGSSPTIQSRIVEIEVTRVVDTAEPVDRKVRREIEERIQELRPLVAEAERLEQALKALEGVDGSPPRTAAQPALSSRGRRSGSRRDGPKMPGARDAILTLVGDRPGITVAELVTASRADRRTVRRLLTLAAKAGQVKSETLPSGDDGFSIAMPQASSAA